jgi:hypothetical protein
MNLSQCGSDAAVNPRTFSSLPADVKKGSEKLAILKSLLSTGRNGVAIEPPVDANPAP